MSWTQALASLALLAALAPPAAAQTADELITRGTVAHNKKDYKAAIADYTEAIKLGGPNTPLAYSNRAQAYVELKDYDKAQADVAEALRIDPKHGLSYSTRGMIHRRLKQFARARADYEMAVRLDPESGYTHNALAWFLATCPDNKVADGKKAVAAAVRACELTEYGNAFFLDTLAAAHAAAGDFDEAVRRQKQALDVPDGFPEEQKGSARQRLELYQMKKPYRED
jgi:Tfp pilus assembly protein PilF